MSHATALCNMHVSSGCLVSLYMQYVPCSLAVHNVYQNRQIQITFTPTSLLYGPPAEADVITFSNFSSNQQSHAKLKKRANDSENTFQFYTLFAFA